MPGFWIFQNNDPADAVCEDTLKFIGKTANILQKLPKDSTPTLDDGNVLLSEEHSEGAWPLLMIGALVFIPGIYHVRIAYFAYRGYPGYAFDDIPDFDQITQLKSQPK